MLWLIISFFGLLSGFLNGFLGTGGGIILVFLLELLWKNSDNKDKIFATTLCVTAVYSVISLLIYSDAKTVFSDSMLPFCICGVTGGIIGAFFSQKIKLDILKIIFAVVCIAGGLNIILR